MPSLSEVREKFPAYKDIPDAKLVDALHKKYYSSMPVEDFHKKIGYVPETPNVVPEKKVASVEEEKRGLLADVPVGVLAGGREAIQQTLNATKDVGEWFNENVANLGYINIGPGGATSLTDTPVVEPGINLPETPQPERITGQLVKPIVQFISEFALLKGAGKKTGIIKGPTTLKQTLGISAAADALAFDPQQERLSNLIQTVPALQNPVSEYLMAKPGDSNAEGRFKNALEGLGLGLATEGLFRVVGGYKDAANKGLLNKSFQEALDTAPVKATGKTVPPIDPSIGKVTLKSTGQTIPAPEVVAALQSARANVTHAGNINLSRISAPDDIKAIIDDTSQRYAPQMDAARGGVQSLEETAKLADALNMKTEDLLKRKKGEAYNAAQAKAARDILVTSTNDVKAAAVKAVGGSDQDLIDFYQKYLTNIAVQEQVSGVAAEAGRTLSSFRSMAKINKDKVNANKILIDRFGKGRDNVEDLAMYVSKLDEASPAAINRFLRESRKTKGDKLLGLWYDSILSGPSTHAVNMVSNFAYGPILSPIERSMSAMISAARKAPRGQRVYLREPVAMVSSLPIGIMDGLRLGYKTMAGDIVDASGKIESAVPMVGENVVSKVYQKIRPTTALQAEDMFFKGIAHRMEIAALSTRQALDEGLKGKALAERIAELKNNPTDKMLAAANDEAMYRTFTQDLGRFGKSMQALRESAPGIKYVIPFLQTPLNILKSSFERSPFTAALVKEARENIAAGGIRRDTQLARLGTGSILTASIAMLAMDGKITGHGPRDPQERKVWITQGNQPMSTKVGNEWRPYGRIEPFAAFGFVADTIELSKYMDDKEKENLMQEISWYVSQNITDKTFLSGVNNFMKAIQTGDDRFLTNLVSSVVPNVAAQTARGIDPVWRDTRSDLEDPIARGIDEALNSIKIRIPGKTEEMTPRIDMFGEVVGYENVNSPFLENINPFRGTPIEEDPLAKEMFNKNILPVRPPQNLKGARLNNAEYVELQKLSGKLFHELGTKLVESPAYAKMPRYAQKEVLRKTQLTARKMARDAILARNPELIKRVVKKKIEEVKGQ